MLLENNINPKVAVERLGHSSVKMFFDRYSHLLPSMQDEAASAIELAMNNAKRTVDKAVVSNDRIVTCSLKCASAIILAIPVRETERRHLRKDRFR